MSLNKEKGSSSHWNIKLIYLTSGIIIKINIFSMQQ